MVQDDRQLDEVMMRIAAVHAALDAVTVELVERRAREIGAGADDQDIGTSRLITDVVNLLRRG